MRRVGVTEETERKILARFVAKIRQSEDGCWIWQGRPDAAGYGKFWVNGYQDYAHRVSHELFIGPIPEGLHVDHLCRVKLCVGPDHLEAVTCQENVLRGLAPLRSGSGNLAKTHCPRDHPYSSDNLYIGPKGKRDCRTCRNAASVRHRARKKGAAGEAA